MVTLSAKGLATFMTSGDARRRSILRNYKYPRTEGMMQMGYYREALSVITRYHRDLLKVDYLLDRARQLRLLAEKENGPRRSKLLSNADALTAYSSHPFSTRRLQIDKAPRMSFTMGDVRVTAQPDAYALEDDQPLVLKFEFAKETADRLADVMVQVLYLAAAQTGLVVKPDDIYYIDVRGGRTYRGSRRRTKVGRDLLAAVETIETLWEAIV